MFYIKKGLPSKEGIIRIAEYSVSEGYDIASFETQESKLHDRFIEVKSYAGESPNFYWSRNEIETARVKDSKYFLYLVNREMFKNLQYEPIILQNPYRTVLNQDNWDKQVENLFISEITPHK